MKKVNLLNRSFGRLTVVKEAGRSPRKDILWLCRCKCGNDKILPTRKLLGGEIISCGCYAREQVRARFTTHGQHKTPTYYSWNTMINRCTNKNHISYKNYGGRGITVCERWLHSFTNFLNDMGERPVGKTLDRIDSNGNYEPGNCKYSTRKEQQRNTRKSIMIEYCGMTKSLPEWCEILGVDYTKTLNRFRYRKLSIPEILAKKD